MNEFEIIDESGPLRERSKKRNLSG